MEIISGGLSSLLSNGVGDPTKPFDSTKAYCGPGPAAIYGTDEANRICYEHDRAYGEIQASGRNPYIYYNEADDKFLKQLSKAKNKGVIGTVAEGVFGVKRALAPEDKIDYKKRRLINRTRYEYAGRKRYYPWTQGDFLKIRRVTREGDIVEVPRGSMLPRWGVIKRKRRWRYRGWRARLRRWGRNVWGRYTPGGNFNKPRV